MENVNAHLHTPYSFSAFASLEDALDQAVRENVRIVGINDFNTTDGFQAWNEGARVRRLFPLFNMEMISLQEDDQVAGLRVNDPNNPGRTYLSGKGLFYPAFLPEPYVSQIAGVRAESNNQVMRMCQKLNRLPEMKQAGINLDFNFILNNLTKGAIRERHLAKALRLEVYQQMNNDKKAISDCLEHLFSGKTLKAGVTDHAAVENEIRANLLKAGGAAFIPEDPKTFLPFETVCEVIRAAGGIPTYPFLADDANGEFTGFEYDLEKAADVLIRRGIFSVEFITPRNSLETLERYAGFLYDHGFIVTLGTEHNTPASEPIELFARGNIPLTNRLKQINYESACVIAAHQERMHNGKQGYLAIIETDNDLSLYTRREAFIHEGNAIIRSVIH
jgi:hypothetical protein